jgi:uncharacterized protein YidB (DUF937 family)
MGLLDTILGNVMGSGQQGGGPLGGAAPRSGSSTSPLMKALMLLLAAKAFQHYTSNRQAGAGQGGGFGGPQGGPMADPRGGGFGGGLGGSLDPRGGVGGAAGGGMGSGMGGGMGSGMGGGMGQGTGGGGGLGGLLSGGLGGLLGGLVGGGGLNAVVNQFRQNGYGDAIDSWVGRGQNQRLAPDQLAGALGPETVDELAQHTGMPRDQVLSELSQELPDAVDQFTPDGRIPTEDEVQSRWV